MKISNNPSSSTSRYARSAARERLEAAYHEAGHAIVADHFGMEWHAWIFRNPSLRPNEKRWVGGVHHHMPSFTGTPAFQHAVISWAGALAENHAIGEGDLSDPDDAVETLIDWTGPSLQFASPSAEDRHGVCRHPHRRRTCRTAARILHENMARLHDLAARLVKDRDVSRWDFYGCPPPVAVQGGAQ